MLSTCFFSISQISFIRDKICYNVGRDLFIFAYRGVLTAINPSKPIDKKVSEFERKTIRIKSYLFDVR